jgi:hypothetical protein
MILIRLKGKYDLMVSSRYDSGTHLGFDVTLPEKNSYNSKSLDEALSKKQIESVEIALMALVSGMLVKPEMKPMEAQDE